MTCELLDGAIFLHIPKTGGQWVYKTLTGLGLVRRNIGRHHHSDFTRAVVFPNYKPRWREWSNPKNLTVQNIIHSGRFMTYPFTFCFVRHPVTWYESSWRYCLNVATDEQRTRWANSERIIKHWMPMTVVVRCLDRDFNQFMRKILAMFPGYVTSLYSAYAPLEIDFVGKQENLAEDLIAVLRKRGLEFDEAVVRQAPEENSSKENSRGVAWDPGLLREVQEMERGAMARFGYVPAG